MSSIIVNTTVRDSQGTTILTPSTNYYILSPGDMNATMVVDQLTYGQLNSIY